MNWHEWIFMIILEKLLCSSLAFITTTLFSCRWLTLLYTLIRQTRPKTLLSSSQCLWSFSKDWNKTLRLPSGRHYLSSGCRQSLSRVLTPTTLSLLLVTFPQAVQLQNQSNSALQHLKAICYDNAQVRIRHHSCRPMQTELVRSAVAMEELWKHSTGNEANMQSAKKHGRSCF